MKKVGIVAAKRTAVCPRNGAFKALGAATDLGSGVIRAVLADAPLPIDQVIMGNALYGGGNPARVAALAAGLPEAIPALTIDTQCCSGLDAIGLARAKIMAGEAQCIVAGGLESYSQSPIRMHRDTQTPYERPPFTPWPERDPDMLDAVAKLATNHHVTRTQQESYAIHSHTNSKLYDDEVSAINGITQDPFTRDLTPQLCARLPLIQGLSSATIAVQADAAAAVVVTTQDIATKHNLPFLEIKAYRSSGGNPEQPALAPITLCRPLLSVYAVTHIELMEAFAVQAIRTIQHLGVTPSTVNPAGGALARGHPIGASGAILAVRLFHAWYQKQQTDFCGLATIAAAGGLASALVMAST